MTSCLPVTGVILQSHKGANEYDYASKDCQRS